MNDLPKIVGPEYLVPILHKELTTIKLDASRKPDSLPPRWKPPWCSKLLECTNVSNCTTAQLLEFSYCIHYRRKAYRVKGSWCHQV